MRGKGQRIQLDVVSDSTPKVSSSLWQVIPGHVNLQLTLKRVRVLELADGETVRVARRSSATLRAMD
jgi:hypothetical protein